MWQEECDGDAWLLVVPSASESHNVHAMSSV